MTGISTRLVKRIATVAGVTVAIAGLLATNASAAVTYTVKAGTKATGTQAYTGQSGAITFSDGLLNLGCDSGTAKGIATLGASVPAQVATITKTTWTNCTGPQGLVLKPVQSGVWTVNGLGATSTKGVTKAYVGNVNARVKSVPAGQCAFTVTGSAPGNYNNATGKLTLVKTTTGTRVLKVSSVSGCFGLINNGDTVGFAASYAITTTKGKLSIASN